MSEEIKVSIEKVESVLVNTKNKFPLIIKKFRKPEDLDMKNYVWVVFTGNIIYKIEDLIILLKNHENKEVKIKAPLYILLRSILEDLFYMRYILADNNLDNIDKRFNAYGYYDSQSKIKHLNSIKKLQEKGKFIYEKDDSRTLSEKGINERITDLENDLKQKDSKYKNDPEFKKITESFKKVEEVCKRYDEVKGINKVEPKKETLSLEWVYNYLYRFKSMYTHQSISAKEDILDCLWHRKSYQDENDEILTLLISIFDTIKETKEKILD